MRGAEGTSLAKEGVGGTASSASSMAGGVPLCQSQTSRRGRPTPAGSDRRQATRAGKVGGRRTRVACSKAYASAIKRGSA